MTPVNNSRNFDSLSESPSNPPLFGQPILSETAEEALKAVIEIRAQELAARLKNTSDYSHGGIND